MSRCIVLGEHELRELCRLRDNVWFSVINTVSKRNHKVSWHKQVSRYREYFSVIISWLRFLLTLSKGGLPIEDQVYSVTMEHSESKPLSNRMVLFVSCLVSLVIKIIPTPLPPSLLIPPPSNFCDDQSFGKIPPWLTVILRGFVVRMSKKCG